jgi:hypothetical protein
MDFNFDIGAIYGGLQSLDVTTLPPLGGQAGVLTIIGTGAITLPKGITSEEPASPVSGMFRYNTDFNGLEYFDGTVWQQLSFASGAVSSFKLTDSSTTPIYTTSPTVSATGVIAATITLSSQSANRIFAGPASGSPAEPTFRALATLDIPPVSNLSGGLAGTVPYQSAPNVTSFTTVGTTGQILTSNGSGAPTWNTLSDSAVTSFSAGTTGFTPATATTGAVTLAGILSLVNGGTNSGNTGSNGSIMYNNGTQIVNSTVGSNNQALLSSGAGAPTWLTVSSTLTTNEILQGDGAGAFTANGAIFAGSPTYSGVTLNGVVTNSTDAVTKEYVDGLTNGLSWKQAVRAGTTVAGTLATSFAAGQTLDTTYTLVLGDRILVKNQTTASENGIYIVTAGTPTRSLDANSTFELTGAAVYVDTGSINANTAWTQVTLDPVIGTNPIVWAQFSGQGTYTAGAGLALSGGQFSVKTDAVTTYIDGSNNVAVLSSTTLDQVLLSQGTGNTAIWGALTLGNSNSVSGILAVVNGGTGATTFTTDGVLYGNGTSAIQSTAAGTNGQVLTVTGGVPAWGTNAVSLAADTGTGSIALGGTLTIDGTTNRISTTATGSTFSVDISTAYVGQASITTLGTVTTGTWNATSIGAAYGGTGQTTYTVGATLYADTTTSLAQLPIGTAGQILTVVAGIPSWTTISTEAVTTFQTSLSGLTPSTPTMGAVTLAGTLGFASGGTGLSTLGTANQFLSVNAGATAIEYKTISAGTGISVTPGAGVLTIANTGVTSVGFSDLSTTPIYTVAGSPVTTTGTLSVTLNSQTANTVFAAPNGSAGQPGFRALVLDDLSGALQLYKENATAPVTPIATGTNSVAIGNGATASATNAFAEGEGSDARIYGQKAYANGSFATAGDAQHGLYVLRNQTTTGTTYTELFLDGVAATKRLVIADNSVYVFDILVAGRRTDATGGGAGYRFVGIAKKDTTAGSMTFIGSPSKTILGETNTQWDARVTANTTTGSILIEVRGEDLKDINWVATVQTTEVTN